MEPKERLSSSTSKALISLFAVITLAGFCVGYVNAANAFGTQMEATLTMLAYGAIGFLVACFVTGSLYLVMSINNRLSQISEQLHHLEKKK